MISFTHACPGGTTNTSLRAIILPLVKYSNSKNHTRKQDVATFKSCHCLKWYIIKIHFILVWPCQQLGYPDPSTTPRYIIEQCDHHPISSQTSSGSGSSSNSSSSSKHSQLGTPLLEERKEKKIKSSVRSSQRNPISS